MRYIPHATVLLLCCTIACVAVPKHRCMHDQIARMVGPPTTVVVREVSRQGNSSGEQALIASNPSWGSIRLLYFTADLNNAGKYCTSASDRRSDFLRNTIQCTERDVLTPERKSRILDVVLPRAVQMHADRLKVERMTSNIIVPKFSNICGNFAIPNDHRTVGVDNADMVLYVAAGPTSGSTLAWAGMCHVLKEGRPIVGITNLSPKITNAAVEGVRVAAHEITHALGFDYFTFSRHANVTTISNVRGKPSVTLFLSPQTVKKTREHFNCPSAEGMELEGDGGDGTALSHWERRNAKDELMSSLAGTGRYTTLTMAAMEDLGFYTAVFEKAEPMSWGKGTGCGFLDEKCVKDGVSKFPNMFCDSSGGPLRCTSDRFALGYCDIVLYDSDLPTQYRYFSNPKLGGMHDRLMDHCPYIEGYQNTGCSNGEQGAMPGSRISSRSRCVKGKSLRIGAKSIGDVCAEVFCANDTIKLRYSGDNTWYDCPEGSTVRPRKTFEGGEIVCPSREDVCFGLEDDFYETPPVDLSLAVSVLLPSVFLTVVISLLAVS